MIWVVRRKWCFCRVYVCVFQGICSQTFWHHESKCGAWLIGVLETLDEMLEYLHSSCSHAAHFSELKLNIGKTICCVQDSVSPSNNNA